MFQDFHSIKVTFSILKWRAVKFQQMNGINSSLFCFTPVPGRATLAFTQRALELLKPGYELYVLVVCPYVEDVIFNNDGDKFLGEIN